MKFSASLQNLDIVICSLKKTINNKNIVVLLQGDLASGKTTFVKQYVKSLNLDILVTSPTFSIQTVYKDDIYHYDIYNKTLDEFIALGLLEEFEKKGIHFVEWGDDKLKFLLDEYGFNVLVVKISKYKNKRQYIVES
jgi:tRNA threonylcarbamoyladenosine biosynthesis protein TsaE